MSCGDLLSIHPTELKFSYEIDFREKVEKTVLVLEVELNKQSSCSLHLTNKTDQHVAFKVKTTNPKIYCVRPNTGIVLSGTTCHVTVTMQAQKEAPPDMQCKDKFLLQSVAVNFGATTKDITPDMFDKVGGKAVEEFKLRVIYVPANPPSPVPEGSEEGLSSRNSTQDGGHNNGSVFATVTKLADEPKDRSSEALSLISKLSMEKTSAIQQSQKLRNELEMLREEVSRSRTSGLSVRFVVLVGLLGLVLGYLIQNI